MNQLISPHPIPFPMLCHLYVLAYYIYVCIIDVLHCKNIFRNLYCCHWVLASEILSLDCIPAEFDGPGASRPRKRVSFDWSWHSHTCSQTFQAPACSMDDFPFTWICGAPIYYPEIICFFQKSLSSPSLGQRLKFQPGGWQTFFQSSYLFILCLSVMLVRFWLEPASTENCHYLLPLVSQKTIQFSTFQSILDCLSAPPLTPPLAPCALGPIRMQHSLVSPYYGGYRFVCVIRCQPEGEDLERFSSCIHEANNYQVPRRPEPLWIIFYRLSLLDRETTRNPTEHGFDSFCYTWLACFHRRSYRPWQSQSLLLWWHTDDSCT
jgi:hypothetical protein